MADTKAGPSYSQAVTDMSFALYLIGFVLLIGGVAWGMATLHVATTWILITCLILLGCGVLAAVKNARSKDLPS